MSRRAEQPGAATRPLAPEFAIRVAAVDELFNEFEAGPVAGRTLRPEVRAYLLDEWEHLRDEQPSRLIVRAPRAEGAGLDDDAIRAAIRADLRTASLPLRLAEPLPRRDRIAARIGIAFLFACIAVSSGLDRISEDVVVEGISQGILVLGWVALWRPAERFVTEVVPHVFNRRRYAEFADIEVAFVWE